MENKKSRKGLRIAIILIVAVILAATVVAYTVSTAGFVTAPKDDQTTETVTPTPITTSPAETTPTTPTVTPTSSVSPSEYGQSQDNPVLFDKAKGIGQTFPIRDPFVEGRSGPYIIQIVEVRRGDTYKSFTTGKNVRDIFVTIRLMSMANGLSLVLSGVQAIDQNGNISKDGALVFSVPTDPIKKKVLNKGEGEDLSFKFTLNEDAKDILIIWRPKNADSPYNESIYLEIGI